MLTSLCSLTSRLSRNYRVLNKHILKRCLVAPINTSSYPVTPSQHTTYGAGSCSVVVRHKTSMTNTSEPSASLPQHELGGSSNPYLITSEFLSNPTDRRNKYCLVLLNYTLPDAVMSLWGQASFKICADGGANRLYDQLPKLLPDEDPVAVRKRFLPDMIKGDLDSMRPDVASFYTSCAVPVLDLSSDQDTTDLTKCLLALEQRLGGSGGGEQGGRPHVALNSEEQVLVLGGIGGRLDHTLSNLNALHQFSHRRIALWGDGNLVRLVRPGVTHILPSHLEGPTCGLIPLAGPATVTTSGLRWNLSGQVMAMRGLISSCNVLEQQRVVVTTDTDLIWTTELKV